MSLRQWSLCAVPVAVAAAANATCEYVSAEFGEKQQVPEWRRWFLDRPEYGGWKGTVVVDYGAGNCNLGLMRAAATPTAHPAA